MEDKIFSIEKGWGEDSTFYTTNPKVGGYHKVDEIKEEFKQTSMDGNGITVYRGFKDGKLVFEMGASIDITLNYREWNEYNRKKNSRSKLISRIIFKKWMVF